jgi:hypothetical protein
MADRYAPALFFEVLAFWLVLRWLLLGRLILLFGRLLVVMMVVGALGTLDEHNYVWAASFLGAGLLAWLFLRRWRGLPTVGRFRRRVPTGLAWHDKSADKLATLCERRTGLHVDAAAPATISSSPASRCVIALAGDGLWVLEDESRFRRPKIGRVRACWDRVGLVAHVQRSRGGEDLELSWPRSGALVRGVMPRGAAADLVAGHLAADELAHRS